MVSRMLWSMDKLIECEKFRTLFPTFKQYPFSVLLEFLHEEHPWRAFAGVFKVVVVVQFHYSPPVVPSSAKCEI